MPNHKKVYYVFIFLWVRSPNSKFLVPWLFVPFSLCRPSALRHTFSLMTTHLMMTLTLAGQNFHLLDNVSIGLTAVMGLYIIFHLYHLVVFFFLGHWSTWTSLAIEMINCLTFRLAPGVDWPSGIPGADRAYPGIPGGPMHIFGPAQDCCVTRPPPPPLRRSSDWGVCPVQPWLAHTSTLA